jgi:regulator of sigma E protease
VRAGAVLTAADGVAVETPADLDAVFAAAGGRPVRLTFRDGGGTVERTVEPRAQLQVGYVPGEDEAADYGFEHLLGLVPVMTVADAADAVTEQGRRAGLEAGDIFASIDSVEYPSLVEGIRRIRANKGRTIPVVVLRRVGGVLERVPLEVHVSGRGRIGFAPSDSAGVSNVLALPPLAMRADKSAAAAAPPTADLVTAPGMRLVAVAGEPVADFAEIRSSLQRATSEAAEAGTGAVVPVTLALSLVGGDSPALERDWSLSAGEVSALHGLAWTPPFTSALFEPREVELRASGPGEAISLGLSETRRVLVTTYVTFARLFERTVKIEHLKGPVGIAHIGTLLADRGFVWVLFFMAVISVNLAVINFLPLPIVDGGQFLMLVYEQVRGRPVPIPVQNAVTMAGLLLIVSLFLIVTFNDVRNLLGF